MTYISKRLSITGLELKTGRESKREPVFYFTFFYFQVRIEIEFLKIKIVNVINFLLFDNTHEQKQKRTTSIPFFSIPILLRLIIGLLKH